MKSKRDWLAGRSLRNADDSAAVARLCASTLQGLDKQARQRAIYPAHSTHGDENPPPAAPDVNDVLTARAAWCGMREFRTTPKLSTCLRAPIQALGFPDHACQQKRPEMWRSWRTPSGILNPVSAPSGGGVVAAVCPIYLPGSPSPDIEQKNIMPSIVTVLSLVTQFPSRPLVSFYIKGRRLAELRCKHPIQYSLHNSVHSNITQRTAHMTSIQDDELYTRKEVAMLAKVCVHTIARDVRAGRLPEIRFNRRRLRHRGSAVKVYLAANYKLGIQHPNFSPPINNTRVSQKVDLNNDGNNDSRVIEAAKTGKVADSAAENPRIPQDSARKPGKQGKKPYNQVLLAHSRRFAVLGLFAPSFRLN